MAIITNGPIVMKLNFLQQGAPKEPAPVVILLHGLFGSLSNLANAARALGNDFTTYQLDLRNHGASPHSLNMSYTHMTADIIEFMDNHAINKAHIIGHSMGGKVAMQVALNYPHRLDKLIVADIAPVTYLRHHNPALEGLQLLAQSSLQSRRQADDLLAKHVSEVPTRAFLLKNLYRTESGDYQLRLNLSAIVNHCQSIADALTGTAFLGPTLFLKGNNSPYIQSKDKNDILRLFPHAEIHVINGAGHWLHSEKPETFNRHVLRFLNN
jgi:esterase